MDFDDLQYQFGASSLRQDPQITNLPHHGSLCRVDGKDESFYILEILLEDSSRHELQIQRKDFDFTLRLFAIMDIESKGRISKATVKEFVTIRCPVFWKRDDNLRAVGGPSASLTFEEVWKAVVTCSVTPRIEESHDVSALELGVEGWVVFCRFIALAQYLEAKRRFSGRHLQQTMRHRNSPRGSELVVVDVPPPAPPSPISADQLAQYERESRSCLPLPELDLDHSLLAAHEVQRRRNKNIINSLGRVKLELFGPSALLLPQTTSPNGVEFCLTYAKNPDDDGIIDSVSVRRSFKDMKWLNETLISQKALGGTLCGRILPPFPMAAHLYNDDLILSSTGDAIAAAANAGVGIIKEGIRSLWGSYKISSPSPANKKRSEKKSGLSSFVLPESYYNPNSPEGISRQLERYLNYLLDHPALSTSFPLNTILKASQSGLEAAKISLEEYSKESKEIKAQTPKLDDGKLSTFWPLNGSSSALPNLSWVRTAAQAAVAIQLHGVLETTGLPSASARLQHASLPSFGHARSSSWNDDDVDLHQSPNVSDESKDQQVEESFEEGVIHVDGELESDEVGYDLLPLPVPTPERTILADSDAKTRNDKQNETRFRYESPKTLQDHFPPEDATDGKPAYIGEMVVDENIDKLREIIGSVDNTLSRCLASSGGIGRARREKLALQLGVVHGLDSWEGLRGKFVSQRALLKGASGLEQSREIFEESDLMLIGDVSWQTSLASSAVSAAEDVRSTVRAARTAVNAKAAASTASLAAQKACETGTFASIDEARAAQTRASIAQSHAIHAAVVEHEAKTAKRRATLALAHDVKCWNKHRKREILETCLRYARSQHEATRREVDAWSCLRDGYVGSAIFPSTQARRVAPKPASVDLFDDEPTATIFGNEERSESNQVLVAVEHDLLNFSGSSSGSAGGDVITSEEPETILPLVVASPIPEEEVSESMNSQSTTKASQKSLSTSTSQKSLSMLKAKTDQEGNEILTASMQSLVDGLMNWGGQYDEEEDFALPTGMAASIALAESGVHKIG